jgi:peptidoglycan/LPS O-acetylase OafA/YrhL
VEAGHIIKGIRQAASRLAESITRAKGSSSPSATPAAEPRIVALDGLRGLMTIMVVISHFFAEVPHGFSGFSFGWIAVEMFFVLSGYLVGRLILEKMDRANFVVVFYVRRVCRTLPVYFFCVVLVFALFTVFSDRTWADPETAFPLWSYLTFFQNFYMVSTDTIGAHWLSPTWTLTVEEHFYLVAPAVFFFVPRHRLIAVFSCAIAVSVFYRYLVFGLELFPRTAGLCLLPGVANGLLCGLIAAILIKTEGIDWKRYDLILRAGPLAALIITIALHAIGDDKAAIFHIWSGLVVSIGCAMYILAIVRGSPEGKRLEHPFYCFFGTNSYSIYLTHLTVLGLMHGLLLNTTPDISTATQMAVTIAALPVSAFIGWLFTQIVEHPITNYGRTWKWSKELRTPKVSASSTPAAVLNLAS